MLRFDWSKNLRALLDMIHFLRSLIVCKYFEEIFNPDDAQNVRKRLNQLFKILISSYSSRSSLLKLFRLKFLHWTKSESFKILEINEI